MAIIRAIANGNWSNTATWFGGVLPTPADNVFANNFTITIDGTFTVLDINTDASTGITLGGKFVFANGGNLTCTNPIGIASITATANFWVLEFNLPAGQSATFTGNISGAFAGGGLGLVNYANSGTFNFNGNCNAVSTGGTARQVFRVGGTGTVNHVGNLTSSSTSGANNNNSQPVYIASNCIYNLTGNVSGGNNASWTSSNINNNVSGLSINNACTVNITGNVIANAAPAITANAAATVNIVGNVSGSPAAPGIYNLGTPSSYSITGIITSGVASAAINAASSLVIVRGNVVNTDTYAAIYAPRITIDNNVTSWQFKDSTNTIIRTLYAAGVALGNPATSNVRFGTTYGASLELTGTMRVPSSINVLQGVGVDNTVGTLLMTPAQCWNYLISSGFVANSIGDRLQNASTVATTGGQIASYNI
jgi:hypothetical protein